MNYYMIEMRNGPITTYLATATSLDEAEMQARVIAEELADEGGADTDLEDDVSTLAWDLFGGDEHAWTRAAYATAKEWLDIADLRIAVAGFEEGNGARKCPRWKGEA